MSYSSQPRALFICGSLNQTTQLHQIAIQLSEFQTAFSPFYAGRLPDAARRLGWLENTILGEKLRRRCLAYLEAQRLAVDVGGRNGPYDVVIACTDLSLPSQRWGAPTIVVQEGMTDRMTWLAHAVQRSRILPTWLPGTTALTASSGNYDRFCAASEGYKALLVRRGAPRDRIVVTGIPNFDDCARYRDHDLPFRGYVLACTSDLREMRQRDDRAAFIARVRSAAAGRPVHFKLHPNEQIARARREIALHCPGALVHTDLRAEVLIAHCDVLFTQVSSVVYVGLALGKEVHSDFDLAELRQLMPIQNGGSSARRIAQVCRELLGLCEPVSRPECSAACLRLEATP